MNSIKQNSRRLIYLLGLFFCFSPPSCEAQTANINDSKEISSKEVADVLGLPVHLRLGKTTLGQVVKALSQQTGQNIECAEYLSEHRMTMQIENASVADVLNQLAELNNWKWTQVGPKHILIARPRAVIPDNPLQISAALKAVLPLDFQRYLGVGVPRDLWLTEAEQQGTGMPNTKSVVSMKVMQKAYALSRHLDGGGWNDLLKHLPDGKVFFPQWTPPVKEAVILSLTAYAFQTVLDPNAVGMLNEDYTPFQRDPMLVEISIHRDSNNHDTINRDLSKDVLMLSAIYKTASGSGLQGFGVNLKFITTPVTQYLPRP